MTRVAILADIHANLPALEAVLADVDARSVDAVFDIGDIVGYGPFPNEVIELLRSREVPSVCGNYDQKVFEFGENRAEFAATKHTLTFRSFCWTHDTLTQESLAYLRQLPPERRVQFEGVELLLVHGSPRGVSDHVGLDSSDEHLAMLADIARADVVACGHSHDTFVKQIGETLFINAGTVGRGSRGDVRASYALVEIDADHASATIEWVPYDLKPLLQGLLAASLPDAFIEMFRQGRQLAQVADLDTGELLTTSAAGE